MVPKKERLKAEQDIANHLAKHGNKYWEKTRNKHKNVPDATWWRWVNKLKSGKVAAPKEHLKKSKEILMSDAASHLPVAPSPATLAKTGAAGVQAIDVFGKFSEVYGDAELLREAAFDGEGNIENLGAFSESIKHRRELLLSMVKSAQVLWELRKMQDYYDLILEAIKDVTPEAARKIADNLGALDKKHGMTINAKF